MPRSRRSRRKQEMDLAEMTYRQSEDEKLLVQCEGVIERGLQTFYEVGQALLTIREKRLYRLSFQTFESYCKARWGMGKTHAYRLMGAAQVVENLSPMGEILPTNERQTRVLAQLNPEQQRQVWRRVLEVALDEKEITESLVEEVIEGEIVEPNFHTSGNLEAENEEPEPDDRPQQKPFHQSIHASSKSCEYYTPPQVIEAVVACLGEIDLDPCSNSLTEPRIPAKHHFTRAENGLMQAWTGKVYMNPPYGKSAQDSTIEQWVKKLRLSYETEYVSEAIALLPAKPGTNWFSLLRDYSVCFVDGRLKFSDLDSAAGFDSAVFYLGNDLGKFYQNFISLGDIWQRIERGVHFGE